MKRFLLILLLLGSLLLRLHHYELYPQRGATSDEYTYSFLGVSLLTEHKPISWSYFEYKNPKIIKIDGILFPIVEPYFDHPPLYGLISGGFALLNGQNTFQKIQLSTIRLVPIALSLATTYLLFLLAKNLFGFETGIMALLIYAVTTTFVINGRVAISENLVAFWFVLAGYLYVRWREKLTEKRTIILGIICGLTFLTQVLSTALFAAFLFYFFIKKEKIRTIVLFALPFVISVLLYLLYGVYFGWDQFMLINTVQSLRPIGPQTFWYIFSTPIIINKIYFDGWYIFSFLMLLLFLFDKKNLNIALIPFFYILLLVLTLTERGQSGWYVIPLFPFMALAASKGLFDTMQSKNLFFSVFLFFVGLFEVDALYRQTFGLANQAFRILLFLLFIPFLASFIPKKENWYRLITKIYFYLLIAGSAFLTFHYVHPA